MKSYSTLNVFVIAILMAVILLPLVSAEIQTLGTFKLNDCIELKQTCSNCTWTNITSVTYPNSSRALGEVEMTKIGTEFNYSCGTSHTLGRYIVNGKSDVNGVTTNWGYDYFVTATGEGLSTSQSIVYIIIFIIALLIFAALLVVGIFMPVKNKTDELTGYILAIENLKYVKYFSLMFAYLVALLIAYFSYSACFSYLNFPFLTSLTYFLFYGLAGCTLIFFPLIIYFMIANWIRDQNISELLSRGLKTRGM